MCKNVVEAGISTTTRTVDRVGASLRIKGEISGSEDLLVEGTVEGPVYLVDHKLTVGSGAKLNSEVVAREVIVHGSVTGNVRASERIEIMKNGSVVGALTTARILIEDGANFKGSIEIDRKAPATGSDTTLQARAATATGQTQSSKTA
jgi:cytoskeletal protein CcmA (bactofilin family)